ncbi:MAG: hypothetical protein WBE63_03740, partial [Acidobacteriaceae bacterium]
PAPGSGGMSWWSGSWVTENSERKARQKRAKKRAKDKLKTGSEKPLARIQREAPLTRLLLPF